MTRLQLGERVVQEYNDGLCDQNNNANPEELLQFVYTIKNKALGQLPSAQHIVNDASNENLSVHSNSSPAGIDGQREECEGFLV